jgi:hypothetical protein
MGFVRTRNSRLKEEYSREEKYDNETCKRKEDK